jgi:NADH:ubiquinone oxidoreductase subunit 2 (subunit N)
LGLVPFHLRLTSPRNDGCPVLAAFDQLLNQLVGYISLTRLYGVTFIGLSHALVTLLMTVCLTSFVVSSVMVARGQSPGVKSIPYWVSSLNLFQGAWYLIGLMVVSLELTMPNLRWGSFTAQNETLALCVYAQLVSVLTCGGVYWTLAHLDRADREPIYLEDVKGLIQFAPLATLTLTIALLCGIGLPLTAGFWGRWLTLLAGHSVHLKASSVFNPHPGIRFAMLAGTVATMVTATFVVRIIREMYLEAPLARPVAIGGRGSLFSGTVVAAIILLLGIAPQIVLVPLQNIRPSRLSTPEANQKGSGDVPMGFLNPQPNPMEPLVRRHS